MQKLPAGQCSGHTIKDRDMQGTAAEKLALFEKLKARGGFDGEDRVELLKVERTLRTFAATEK